MKWDPNQRTETWHCNKCSQRRQGWSWRWRWWTGYQIRVREWWDTFDDSTSGEKLNDVHKNDDLQWLRPDVETGEDKSKQVTGTQLQPREQIVEMPMVQDLVEYRFPSGCTACWQRMFLSCWSKNCGLIWDSKGCNPSLLRKSFSSAP